MQNAKWRCWFSTVMTLVACGGVAARLGFGQEPSAVPKFDFAAAAEKYEITVGRDGAVCEPIHAEVLRWTNPVRGTAAGTVFLWLQKGIPQAACCMYAYRDRDVQEDYLVDHEFVSFSPELLAAKHDGIPVWQTRQPGIVWQHIADGPEVSNTRAGRLAQMRQLASEFIGEFGRADSTREQLRLLRKPIYRYADSMEQDGAVFAFAQATDPEILLLVETNRKADKPTWRFAAVRMTMVDCHLHRDSQEVWTAKWWIQSQDESQTYLTRPHVPWTVLKVDEKKCE